MYQPYKYMINILIDLMIYLGAALMVINIGSFISYARKMRNKQSWSEHYHILYIPIVLLVFFLLGYLFVGFFGKPDLMVAGILFFGSVFVFVMYKLIDRITALLMKSQQYEAELLAAEKANRAKTELLASVSHEMRTPMNVIIGLDKIALSEPGISDTTKDHLEKIGHSADHMLGLINNILEMNQLENNELPIKNEAFSLGDLLKQLETISGTLCEQKGLRFVPKFAPSASRIYIGDSSLLRQILISILDNAVKYTDAPGQVDFSVYDVGNDGPLYDFEFMIKDTGIGMSQDFLPKLFSLFSQEDSSSTSRYGGSGISLAMTNEMVKKLGGEIRVFSRKDVGSTFTVCLRLRLSENQEELQSFDDISLENRKILVVDDIDENAEIVSDLLELEGAISERAEDGLKAVEMVRASDEYYYDAILMDLRMPVMDGLEAARKIREMDRKDTKDIPIIALTANAFREDIENSLKAGMNAHLAKPADTDALYGTLKRLIDLYDKKKAKD